MKLLLSWDYLDQQTFSVDEVTGQDAPPPDAGNNVQGCAIIDLLPEEHAEFGRVRDAWDKWQERLSDLAVQARKT